MAKQGLALPATRLSGGYFSAQSGFALARGSLAFTLLTPIGSRPMQRAWGSGLKRCIMNPVNVNDSILMLMVSNTAQLYVPDVIVTGVQTVGKNYAGLNVSFKLAPGV